MFQWCQYDTNPQPGARSENADVHTLEDLSELLSHEDNGAALSTSRRVSSQHFLARPSWRKTQCRVSNSTLSKCFCHHRTSFWKLLWKCCLLKSDKHSFVWYKSHCKLVSTPPWSSPAPAASLAVAPAAFRSPCSAGRCAPCVCASPLYTSAAGFPAASLSSAGLLKVWWDHCCPLLLKTQNAGIKKRIYKILPINTQ